MTLYRTYRPQTFAEVIGHEAVKKTLQQALRDGKTAHSYLFVGPRGSGKTTLARLLAKSLNCQNWNAETAEPCLQCTSCLAVLAGNHLDVLEIDAASNRGIDEIRQLKETIHLEPVMGKQKVYIIDEVHMLTKEAFNALLKTLEEPPPKVTFILATTEVQKVPATIISRCQRFDLRPASLAEITTVLQRIVDREKRTATAEALDLIARQAEGGHRDAASLLEQVLVHAGEAALTAELVRSSLGLPDRTRLFRLLGLLADGGDSLAEFRALAEGGSDVAIVARQLTELWRAVAETTYLASHSLPGDWGAEEEAQIRQAASRWSAEASLDLLGQIIEAVGQVKQSPIASLPLELWLLKAARLRIASSASQQTPTLTEQTTESNVSAQMNEQLTPTKPETPQEIPPTDMSPTATETLDTSATVDWPMLIERLKLVNFSLAALLRDAKPQSSTNGLVIVVKYDFHRKKLLQLENRQLLEKELAALRGKPVMVDIKLEGEVTLDGTSEPVENINQLVTEMFDVVPEEPQK